MSSGVVLCDVILRRVTGPTFLRVDWVGALHDGSERGDGRASSFVTNAKCEEQPQPLEFITQDQAKCNVTNAKEFQCRVVAKRASDNQTSLDCLSLVANKN